MNSILVTLALSVSLLAPAAVRAADSPDWATRCIPTLTEGGYAEGEQAEILCTFCSQAELGCAMDAYDMQMFSDFVEAAEYCRAQM